MADEADLADVQTELRMAEGLAANAQRLRPENHPDFDGSHCVECGDDLPAQRLAMGRVRCTHCQSMLEHRRRFAA
jgi:RNA polymerase-binding transcription factor DksA